MRANSPADVLGSLETTCEAFVAMFMTVLRNSARGVQAPKTFA
jgi:hypothetical protein